ncbi:MAG: hypothetical protein KGR71_14530 [Proteobacteria bacterium]|nr:hypothetical protein [Pseudomonadota bacterium]
MPGDPMLRRDIPDSRFAFSVTEIRPNPTHFLLFFSLNNAGRRSSGRFIVSTSAFPRRQCDGSAITATRTGSPMATLIEMPLLCSLFKAAGVNGVRQFTHHHVAEQDAGLPPPANSKRHRRNHGHDGSPSGTNLGRVDLRYERLRARIVAHGLPA